MVSAIQISQSQLYCQFVYVQEIDGIEMLFLCNPRFEVHSILSTQDVVHGTTWDAGKRYMEKWIEGIKLPYGTWNVMSGWSKQEESCQRLLEGSGETAPEHSVALCCRIESFCKITLNWCFHFAVFLTGVNEAFHCLTSSFFLSLSVAPD